MRGMPNFLRDDKGSQTIEFVLWLPIIGALLVIISYASILYTAHTEMWNVARDTARRMTTGVLEPGVPAEDYAKSQLRLYEFFDSGDDSRYDVVATKEPEPGASTMTVVITLDVANGSFDGGYLGSFTLVGGLMSARVVMPIPPDPPVVLARP